MQNSFSGPLYQQVHELLRGRIASGEWRSGAPIPGEADLSRELGVSVGTVRKALDKLARERVVFRERGRGTFVKDDAVWSQGPGFRLCDEAGRPIRSVIAVAGIAVTRATAAELQALRLARRAALPSNVVKITREWSHDGTVLGLEVLTLDETRFLGLADEPGLDRDTLFDMYAERFRAKVDRTVWTFKPLDGSDPRGTQLDADKSAPLMHCRRIALDAKDAPIEICDQILRCETGAYQLVQ